MSPEAVITVETAAVYRSFDGRRFLTKRAAAKASARYVIKSRYPCECDPFTGGPDDTGYTCDRHTERGLVWYAEVEKRLARRILRKGVGR